MTRRQEVYLLPHVKDEGAIIPRGKEDTLFSSYLNDQQIQENIGYLERLYHSIPMPYGLLARNTASRAYAESLYFKYRATYDRYKIILQDTQRFEPIAQSLKRQFPSLHRLGASGDESLEEIQRNVERIAESGTDTQQVFMSPSHATTYAVVHAAKAKKPDAKVGLMVFDNHVDIHISSIDLHPPGYPSNQRAPINPRKANFLWKLMDEGQVEAASLFGTPARSKKRVETGKGFEVLYYPTHSIAYQNIKDRLKIISSDQMHGDKKLSHQVRKQLEFFRSKGITNVILSVDIDALSSPDLTTAEYSPMMDLLLLSLIDFRKIEDMYPGARSEDRVSVIENVLDAPERFPKLFSLPNSPDMMQLILETSILRDESGQLSSSQIIQAITQIKKEASSFGMNVGIDFGENTVIGDITELSLPDYRGKTAQAVSQIVSAMAEDSIPQS